MDIVIYRLIILAGSMTEFATIALPGAYQASLGALMDSFALVYDRMRHVVRDEQKGSPDMRLTVLSADGSDLEIQGRTIVRVDRAISATDQFDFIWLPAFRAASEKAMRQRLTSSSDLIRWLRDQSEKGAVVAASGAAALLLISAKLTEGRRVPISRALMPLARAMFPRFQPEERLGIVDYGNVLIANGIGNDLALVVRAMERLLPPDSSRWLTSVTGLKREEGELLAGDPVVAAAQIWLEQRFASGVSIASLANELSISHPTLIRRFKKSLGTTPNDYVQQLRLAAGQDMLARSNRTVDSIAALVGYSDARLFRTMFRQKTGMTATAWRAQHSREKSSGNAS
jgi:transcriptional regulator GlxA family with amidase domain